ncbi:MAG: hypothetical protein BMS9Abin11_0138 [Gammaproteobacteria bacterium]|nr:MAG: hypothetical protein BMS9Abin11_0138 [Gammaproteobacteria bacterium]
MFEETVCKADKSRMMDEIIEKNLLDPERPVGLLHTGNTKQAKDKARIDADFDSPPDPFDNNFIACHWSERADETNATIQLPAMRCSVAKLGNVSGLKQVVYDSRELLGTVRGLWSALQQSNSPLAPEVLDGLDRNFRLLIEQQGKKTGQPVPEPVSQGVELNPRFRIEQNLKQIDNSLNHLRFPDFHISEGQSPDENIVSYDETEVITITAPAYSNGVLMIFSKMESTYSFPGKGTNWGERMLGPSLAFGDRPWFAKVALPVSQIIDENGLPYASYPTQIAQLGVAGSAVQVHQYTVSIPGSGELKLPLQLNGSYGKARFIFLPEDTRCQPVDEMLLIRGQYEDNYIEQELIRFRKTSNIQRLIAANITLSEQLLSSMASALSVVPEIGDMFNIAIQTLQLYINHTKQSILDNIESKNHAQQEINLMIAKQFPRSGPIGLPEDNYPPH